MTKSFTIYWTPEGWAGIGEGNPIPGAFGSGFKEKIPPGSRIFVTNIQGGALRLVGAFTAGSIETLNPSAETWNASEQLIAENGSAHDPGSAAHPALPQCPVCAERARHAPRR